MDNAKRTENIFNVLGLPSTYDPDNRIPESAYKAVKQALDEAVEDDRDKPWCDRLAASLRYKDRIKLEGIQEGLRLAAKIAGHDPKHSAFICKSCEIASQIEAKAAELGGKGD